MTPKPLEEMTVEELRKRVQELEELNRIDPLTGAYNRRGFEEALEKEMARLRRDGVPVGLLIIDLDKFKEVNDTLGHKVGDVVLRKVVECIKNTIRATDTVCRIGGDEFAVVLHNTDVSGSRVVAYHIVKAVLETPIPIEGNKLLTVRLSIGGMSTGNRTTKSGDLIHSADSLMYHAKRRSEHHMSESTDEFPPIDLLVKVEAFTVFSNLEQAK